MTHEILLNTNVLWNQRGFNLLHCNLHAYDTVDYAFNTVRRFLNIYLFVLNCEIVYIEKGGIILFRITISNYWIKITCKHSFYLRYYNQYNEIVDMYNRFYYTYIDVEHKTIIAPFYTYIWERER